MNLVLILSTAAFAAFFLWATSDKTRAEVQARLDEEYTDEEEG